MSELLKKLSAPFPASEVRQRPGGRGKLDYVGWDSVVRRLNDVAEFAWSLVVDQSSVRQIESKWLGEVQVSLTISDQNGLTSTRGGVGAALMNDPDDALKSAQAEALKKASNQFGMALELWTEEGREVVARGRAAAKGDVASMKTMVFELALAKGAEPNAKSVAEKLNIDVEELQNPDCLAKILADDFDSVKRSNA